MALNVFSQKKCYAEEHEALFGDSGDFGEEIDEEEELEDELMYAGLDKDDFDFD